MVPVIICESIVVYCLLPMDLKIKRSSSLAPQMARCFGAKLPLVVVSALNILTLGCSKSHSDFSLTCNAPLQPLCCWWLIWPIQNDAKNLKNDMGTHRTVLREIFPMNTNKAGLRWFSNLCLIVLWMKIVIS